MKRVLLTSAAMLAIGFSTAAQADAVQDVTNALSSAIAQRVGDQVSSNNTADLKKAVSGNFGASGQGSSSTFYGLGSFDAWVTPDHLWGGAFDYATDNKGNTNIYGGAGYFADVYKRTDTQSAFILVILNVSGSSIKGPLITTNTTNFAGTVDANWQWKMDRNLTRFDIGYTGAGQSSGGSFNSTVFANVEEDFTRAKYTPFLRAGISENFGSGTSTTAGQVGAGFRAEVSDRTTFTMGAGANIANKTGWYANIALRSRF